MPSGLIVKAGTLNVSRHNCFIVVACVPMSPDTHHELWGKWLPWTFGAKQGIDPKIMVFPSKHEAIEQILHVASSICGYEAPIALSEEGYEAFLLHRWFRVEPYDAKNDPRTEIMYSDVHHFSREPGRYIEHTDATAAALAADTPVEFSADLQEEAAVVADEAGWIDVEDLRP